MGHWLASLHFSQRLCPPLTYFRVSSYIWSSTHGNNKRVSNDHGNWFDWETPRAQKYRSSLIPHQSIEECSPQAVYWCGSRSCLRPCIPNLSISALRTRVNSAPPAPSTAPPPPPPHPPAFPPAPRQVSRACHMPCYFPVFSDHSI